MSAGPDGNNNKPDSAPHRNSIIPTETTAMASYDSRQILNQADEMILRRAKNVQFSLDRRAANVDEQDSFEVPIEDAGLLSLRKVEESETSAPPIYRIT